MCGRIHSCSALGPGALRNGSTMQQIGNQHAAKCMSLLSWSCARRRKDDNWNYYRQFYLFMLNMFFFFFFSFSLQRLAENFIWVLHRHHSHFTSRKPMPKELTWAEYSSKPQPTREQNQTSRQMQIPFSSHLHSVAMQHFLSFSSSFFFLIVKITHHKQKRTRREPHAPTYLLPYCWH